MLNIQWFLSMPMVKSFSSRFFYTYAICIQNRILAIPILIHQLICFKYIQDIISFPRESSTRWNVRFGHKLRKTKLLKLLRYILLILSLHRKRKGARYDLHDCKNNTFISFFIYVDLFSFLFIRVLWNKGNCVNHLIFYDSFLTNFDTISILIDAILSDV